MTGIITDLAEYRRKREAKAPEPDQVKDWWDYLREGYCRLTGDDLKGRK